MPIHVITEHFRSARWIELQLGKLARHLHRDYVTYTCLEGVEPAYRAYFDIVIPARGAHAGKLNLLARVAADASSSDDDILVFLDGDAFPVANMDEAIENWLSQNPLAAVRRDENLGDPQPHPCCCVTTIGFWKAIIGDWSAGYLWTAADGTSQTDPGGNLLYALNQNNIAWKPLLRTSGQSLHPTWFGIYDDVVYHHGSGFYPGVSRQVVAGSPWTRLPGSFVPRRVRARLQRRWVLHQWSRSAGLSEQVFSRLSIEDDSLAWLDRDQVDDEVGRSTSDASKLQRVPRLK